MIDTVYLILDYDGYVCKSFYANKDNPMDIESSVLILNDLKESAISKAKDYFNTSNIKVLPIMSTHSWKKDIYPSYKRSRKRNEYLGVYREYIKQNQKDIITVESLEADEIIVCISDLLTKENKNFIVFSDDKDLRYYSELFCKINITENIIKQEMIDIWKEQLEQMIIGDREDNIIGIPKVGEKTAPKLLENYSYDIKGVVRCFRDKDVDIDNCLRDLLLVIPMSSNYTIDSFPSEKIAKSIINNQKVDNTVVYESIIGQVKYLNEIVTEIYNDKS